MNPHDAAEQPGAHLVFEVLGIDSPSDLVTRHPHGDPLAMLGRLVADAARDVDELHGQLTHHARSAIRTLEAFASGRHAELGRSYGILRSTGPEIELLAARRGEAFEHLNRTVDAYDRCLPKTAGGSTAPGQTKALQSGPVVPLVSAALSRSQYAPAPAAATEPAAVAAPAATKPGKPARAR